MLRIGVIGIVLKENKELANQVQKILGDYSKIIVGRMGVPDKETSINTISIIVKGKNEEISALAGKLGKLNGLSVKSALTAFELDEKE